MRIRAILYWERAVGLYAGDAEMAATLVRRGKIN